MRRRAIVLLLVVTVGCRGPGEVPKAIRWVEPDSMPQLRAVADTDSLAIAVPSCSREPALIHGDSIGPIVVGMTRGELVAACPQVLVGWDWGAEAIPEPALAVSFGGGVVVAVLTDTAATGTVYVLKTASRSIRTATGVGVGSSIEQLVTAYGNPRFDEYECGLHVRFESAPALGFLLAALRPDPDCGQLVPPPGQLPNGAVVARVGVAKPRARAPGT